MGAEIARHSTLLRQRLGRGVSVGISGVDCAGKSTVAEALNARFVAARIPVVVVEGDEFTRPRKDLRARELERGPRHWWQD